MAFRELLETNVAKFNDRMKTRSEYNQLLKDWNGRSLVLKIRDDLTYVIYINLEGLRLEISPQKIPEDMYLEMSTQLLKKMIDERKVNPMDVMMGKIKFKEISLQDVSKVRQIFGA
ncbi:MAG: SCP2 sterol-binding domain-containing protein [Candidatus Bathyarchaeota archaeon]